MRVCNRETYASLLTRQSAVLAKLAALATLPTEQVSPATFVRTTTADLNVATASLIEQRDMILAKLTALASLPTESIQPATFTKGTCL